jgi:hypothetical protein
MFDVECSMFDVRFVAAIYARIQKQAESLFYSDSTRTR